MKLAFMGTPEFAVPFLQALHRAGHEIAAVYTQPPRQGGRRGLSKLASPVSRAAQALNLPIYSPQTLREPAEQARFQTLAVDAAIIVAYGLLLPEPILQAPRLGCYNAHASLLPRWRGAAPVQRALAAGDKKTGLVIMRMEKGLDTGPILCARPAAGDKSALQPFVYTMPIGADTTAGELFAVLAAKGAELMAQAVAALAKGQTGLKPQAAEGITYAHKIAKEETRINWQQPAAQAHKHICSLSPFPGAWCEMLIGGKRERVKILSSHCANKAEEAAARRQGLFLLPGADKSAAAPVTKAAASLAVQCAKGVLLLTRLQKAGGRELPARDFLRGALVQAIY